MVQILLGLLIIAAQPQGRLAPVDGLIPHYARMIADVPPIPAVGLSKPGGHGGPPLLGVDSFPSPDTTPFGLEIIGGMLWNSDLRAQRIYQLDPDNGSVKRDFAAPDAWSKDMAFDGTYLDICGNYESRIYRVDTTSGSVVSSYYAPGSNPVGLCFDGTYLWNADLNSDQSQPSYIYKLNPANGQVISSILTPAEQPAGLAWDGSHLWNVDMKNRVIYELDPMTGKVLGAIGTPGMNPTGLALDGSEVWNCDWAGGMIYHFELDSAPPVLAMNSPQNYDALPCWQNLAVIGTIWGPDLQQYTVEYAAGETPGTWTPIGPARTEPVYLDTLGSWDVSGITDPGIYWLRLNAVFTSQTDTTLRVKFSLDPQIMTGWPQTFVNPSLVGVADVYGTGVSEVFAGLNHQDGFNQKLAGWQLDGAPLSGFPVAGINNCQMAPAFAPLPHSDSLGIATGYDLNHEDVNIVRPNGTMLTGWPQTGGHPGTLYYLGLPVIADVNGDSLVEVFAGGSSLSSWHFNGSEVNGWPLTSQLSSPAIGDVNRDGYSELAAISGSTLHVSDSAGVELTPFPKTYSGSSTEQYPVLGDINGDQRMEIVFNLGTHLYAVDDTGGVLAGFPKTLSGSYANSPILGDLDRDGYPDIVAASGTFPSYTQIAAYHYDGTSVSGFPKMLSSRIFRAFNDPVLADINADSFPEVVMGFEVENTFEEIHALKHDGNEATGWPKFMRDIYGYGITGSPVIADFDGDGDVDMAISSNAYWMANSDICVWDLDQPLVASAIPWPTQRHDLQRTACLGNVATSVEERVSEPPDAGIIAQPNPFREKVILRLPRAAGCAPIELGIYDAAGRRVREMRLAVSGQRSASWDGTDRLGAPVASGIYFLRARLGDRLVSTRLVLQR
jgi:hypothetical protein